MANYNYQNVNVNIIDVDTQKVILKDFTLYFQSNSLNYLIRGGSDMVCAFPTWSSGDEPTTVQLLQMEEYGYEWASEDANMIKREYNSYQGGTLLPSVINLYLRKTA